MTSTTPDPAGPEPTPDLPASPATASMPAAPAPAPAPAAGAGNGIGPDPGVAVADGAATVPPPARRGSNRSPVRLSLVAAVILLLISAAGAATARSVVSDQEHRLLKERAAEAGLVVSSDFGSLSSTLDSYGTIAILEKGDPAEFTRVVGQANGSGEGAGGAVALVRTAPAGPTVVASVGKSLPVGDVLIGARAVVGNTALQASKSGLYASSVLAHSAKTNTVAFVIGPPQAPPGEAVYEEVGLPTVVGTQDVGNAFAELKVAVYAGSTADPSNLLLTTTGGLPTGSMVSVPVNIGNSKWLLVAGARESLVGALTTATPLLLLLGGIVGSLLVAAVFETVLRRRDYAMALVDERTAALRSSLQELESTQAQLVRQERLAAVGQLASAVGHELRNPLGVITNSLYLIRRSTEGAGDERLKRQLSTAEREVAAATLIVSDLLDFARARQPIIKPVELPGLIDEALEVASPPEGIGIDWQRPSDLRPVAADRDQLRQVLLNIIMNGYDSMPDGGTLRLRAQAVGTDVRIAITDQGSGMDEETRARLFEPFYTTKTRGTGLGLAVSERIMSAHGGSISVDSKLGSGTTFTLVLRDAAQPTPARPDPTADDPAADDPGNGARGVP
jgi:signal transduction histidine kinase